jgi:eukaryotic-like serine/threonine-protein kinase
MTRSADLVLDDGTVAVVKVAEGDAVADLRREAERLEASRHPGVVEVLRSSGDEGRWELRTAHGGRPVSLLHLATPEQVAHVAAEVADVLADLHDRGVVHGRLAARHVLVGPGGGVRLCGFGPDPQGATPADDVAAVGSVIVQLLGDGEVLEPAPERGFRRGRPWPGVLRRALLTFADLASVEPASRRPSARQLSAAIRDTVPGQVRGRHFGRPDGALRGDRAGDRSARRPATRLTRATDARPTSSPGPGADRSPRRWAPALAASAGLALLTVAVGDLVGPGPRPRSDPSAILPCAAVDAAAPCEPVRIDGTTVTVGTIRFAVGAPGDQVAVGDWDCDGNLTPAVLRPSTGEVFLFPGWAGDDDLQVPAAGLVPGARELQASPGRCGPPVVIRDDDRRISLDAGGSR